MTMLAVADLHHAYRRFPGRRVASLVGVDLDVGAGEAWALVGPNGSGKSTLLRVIAGLAPARAGGLHVMGHPAGSRTARRLVGYVPDAVRWPRTLTVRGVLEELATLASVLDVEARVERVLAIVGLAPLARRRIGSLSFGQARRVAVAQALLDSPPVLLLDEPFSGLDSLVIHDVRAELRARLDEGAALVLASHRLEDVRELCTHVLVLRGGAVERRGRLEDVLAGADERAALVELLGAGA